MASLPRHAILRIAALHFVSGMMSAFADPVKSQLNEAEKCKAAVLATRIEMSVQRANDMEYDGNHDRRVTNYILRCLERLDESLPEEVDARIIANAVLELVARQEEDIPRTPKFLQKRMEWGTLHSLLFEFYSILDENLTADAEIGNGYALAGRIAIA